jgi:hypothetical protein
MYLYLPQMGQALLAPLDLLFDSRCLKLDQLLQADLGEVTSPERNLVLSSHA